MFIHKIIKKPDSYEYVYAINYRKDFLRASVTVFTDSNHKLKSIKYVSSVFGVVQINNQNVLDFGYLWEDENDIEKLSNFSRHYTAVMNKPGPDLAKSEIDNIVDDCLRCADDLNLIHFIRSRNTPDEVDGFPDFEFAIESPIKSISPELIDLKKDTVSPPKGIMNRFGKIKTNLKNHFFKILSGTLAIGLCLHLLTDYRLKIFKKDSPDISIDLAHYLVSLGKSEEAKKVYWNLLNQNPDQCQIGIELVNYSFFAGAGFADTIQWIHENYYTFNPAMHLTLAYIDHRLGFNEKAMVKLEQLQGNKNTEKCVLHVLANIHMQSNINKSLELYRAIIKLDPTYVYAYINIASVEFYRGNEKLGIEYMQKAKEIDPENYTSYLIHGKYFSSIKNYQRAKEEYKMALRKNPNMPTLKNELNQIELKISQETGTKK